MGKPNCFQIFSKQVQRLQLHNTTTVHQKQWPTKQLENNDSQLIVPSLPDGLFILRSVQNADCRLQTADCRPGTKCRLQTADRVQNADQV